MKFLDLGLSQEFIKYNVGIFLTLQISAKSSTNKPFRTVGCMIKSGLFFDIRLSKRLFFPISLFLK